METKTNEQGLTYIAECIGLTLTQLVFYYSVNDEFKDSVDTTLNDINPRRIENGFEKLDVNNYLNNLVEQN